MASNQRKTLYSPTDIGKQNVFKLGIIIGNCRVFKGYYITIIILY